MIMARVSRGVIRKDGIKNGHIRWTLEVDMCETLDRRQSILRWYGRVTCLEDECVGRKVLEMKLTGKGRPPRKTKEEAL